MSKRDRLKKIGKGLAGAFAIASGTSAYGSVVYVNTPPDLMTGAGGADRFANWDVNGDGTNDFVFEDRFPNTVPGNTGVVWQMNMDPLPGTEATNGLLSYAGPFVQYAFALSAYQSVGSSRSGFSTEAQVALGSKYSYGSQGVNYYGGFAAGLGYLGMGYNSVQTGTLGFVGFRFHAADGTHYGFIRLSVAPGIIDFDFAAYNTTPNDPVITFVPEPGTMALLALGAIGVVGAVVKKRRRG